MNLIEVNPQSCLKDGICAAVCPGGLLDFAEGAYPKPINELDGLCIRCGHCVAACPNGSLGHQDIPLEQCPPIQPELQLSAAQSEQFLRARRSVRAYQPRPVPRETLGRLLELARYAPTGHNAQGVQWLVLDQKDELQRLAALVAEWMRWMLTNMTEFALSLHMDRALARYEAGHDIILRDAPVLIVAHGEKSDRLAPSSCTIALTTLELAATGMALGTCWAGYFNAAATTFPPLVKALDLPQGHQCFGAMMVGFPRFRYQRLPPRPAPAITWR